MTKLDLMEKVASEKGWVICKHDNWYIFSRYSPAGQDFNAEIDFDADETDPEAIYENVVENLALYVYNFDVSYEAYLWLDNTGHGKNGAPYDMRDVYIDMEWCADKMEELYRALADAEME